MTADDRFRAAARAYFGYGVVYWIGGVYLAWYGVGVRAGGALLWRGMAWIVVGLVFVMLIPFLLRRRRESFERWILSRRDFARILAALMAVRAFAVARVAIHHGGASIPTPWGGVVTFQAGAALFFLVTVTALVFVARAAWSDDGGR